MLTYLTTDQILSHYGLLSDFSYSFTQSTLSKSEFEIKTSTLSSKPNTLYAKRFTLPVYLTRFIGLVFICLSLGALISMVFPFAKLEAMYTLSQVKNKVFAYFSPQNEAKIDLPIAPQFNPLIDTEGNPIVPVNKDFSIVIPKIGINATIIPGVNPVNTVGYNSALTKGVAHASTSFYPDQNGTVYLFSHSTNYEWFVKDLNAVFYLLKNLETGDHVVIMYLGHRYTYEIREKKIISWREVGYLTPQPGSRNLILQTCWPPGSTAKRLLFFADLIEEKKYGSFGEEMGI